MGELWELVDIDEKKTGTIIERNSNTPIPRGMFNRAVDIWTKSRDGKILLTQRHPNKFWGGYWECSGGAIIKGENHLMAAQRELYEETGIKLSKESFEYLGKTILEEYQCIMYTYVVRLADDVNLNLQAEEVVDAKWVEVDELENIKDDIVKNVWDRYLKYKEQIINNRK